MLYVVVGLDVSSKIPGDTSDTTYGIPFAAAKNYPFLVIDTIHQYLGDQIVQQLRTRVGLLAHYFHDTPYRSVETTWLHRSTTSLTRKVLRGLLVKQVGWYDGLGYHPSHRTHD